MLALHIKDNFPIPDLVKANDRNPKICHFKLFLLTIFRLNTCTRCCTYTNGSNTVFDCSI